MPGPVSDSSAGPGDGTPYIPTWLYPRGPKLCPCGHHEGFHDGAGACLLRDRCGCVGIPSDRVTSDDWRCSTCAEEGSGV